MPAGCSGTPLTRNLGVAARHAVALVGAPLGRSIPRLDDDRSAPGCVGHEGPRGDVAAPRAPAGRPATDGGSS